MSLRKTFFVICVTLSVLCLAGGYGAAGYWVGAAIALLLVPAWWFAQKDSSSLPAVCLSVAVGMAVVGRLMGCSPVWMILGSAAALAAWDLIFLDSAVGKGAPAEPTRRYENWHLRSLALALGSGLVATVLGRSFNLQLPFVVLLLLLAFTLFALDIVWGYIKKVGKG